MNYEYLLRFFIGFLVGMSWGVVLGLNIKNIASHLKKK